MKLDKLFEKGKQIQRRVENIAADPNVRGAITAVLLGTSVGACGADNGVNAENTSSKGEALTWADVGSSDSNLLPSCSSTSSTSGFRIWSSGRLKADPNDTNPETDPLLNPNINPGGQSLIAAEYTANGGVKNFGSPLFLKTTSGNPINNSASQYGVDYGTGGWCGTGKIVYESWEDGRVALYSADIDTSQFPFEVSNQEILPATINTSIFHGFVSPALNSDCSMLIYADTTAGNKNLRWAVPGTWTPKNVEGTGVLTSNPETAPFFCGPATDKESKLCFMSTRSSGFGQGDLYMGTVNFDGQTLTLTDVHNMTPTDYDGNTAENESGGCVEDDGTLVYGRLNDSTNDVELNEYQMYNTGGSAGSAGSGGAGGASGSGGVGGSAGMGGMAGSAGEAGSGGVGGSAGEAGSAGMGGSAGEAGSAGTGGMAGSAGEAGSAGVGGSAGEAGSAGMSGSAGEAGSAGSSPDGGTDAGVEWENCGVVQVAIAEDSGASCSFYCEGNMIPVMSQSFTDCTYMVSTDDYSGYSLIHTSGNGESSMNEGGTIFGPGYNVDVEIEDLEGGPKISVELPVETGGGLLLAAIGTKYDPDVYEADDPNNPYGERFVRVLVTEGEVQPSLNGVPLQILDDKGNVHTSIKAGFPAVDISLKDGQFIGAPIVPQTDGGTNIAPTTESGDGGGCGVCAATPGSSPSTPEGLALFIAAAAATVVARKRKGFIGLEDKE